MILFPVILPVVENMDRLSGRENVALLSKVSRQALKLSAEKSGVVLGELSKDEKDVPLPFGSYYWSISHKPRYVAAVIGDSCIGIDIEEVRPRPESIFGYVASDEDWDLMGGKSLHAFFRCWTAKEAVLKAAGIGIGGLMKCRVLSVPDEVHIILNYQDCDYEVEQLYYNNHIVTVLKNDNKVEWVYPVRGKL